MTTTSLPHRPTWKALEEHFREIHNVALRWLFAEDPERGQRLAVEETWRVVEPLLESPPPVETYAKGSWGPKAADAVVRGCDNWHEPWLPDTKTQERV